VNGRVFQNTPVTTTVEELEAAKARGVVAMFGEKYEEKVRVLDVGGWSLELCGDTHVRASGDIGPFVILSERAVQAGVRRIEAVTGPAAVEEIQRQRRVLREASQALKTSPEEIGERIAHLQAQLKEAKKAGAKAAGGDVESALATLKAGLSTRGGTACGVFDFPDLGLEGVRDLADRARSLAPAIAFAVFGRQDGRVPFVIACQGVPKASGLHAGNLAKLVGGHLGGGGGGRPDSAQGQGQNPDAVPAALRAVQDALAGALGAS
jgi:alanyl-tRNA synthetase